MRFTNGLTLGLTHVPGGLFLLNYVLLLFYNNMNLGFGLSTFFPVAISNTL